jgi:hypothetical protein
VWPACLRTAKEVTVGVAARGEETGHSTGARGEETEEPPPAGPLDGDELSLGRARAPARGPAAAPPSLLESSRDLSDAVLLHYAAAERRNRRRSGAVAGPTPEVLSSLPVVVGRHGRRRRWVTERPGGENEMASRVEGKSASSVLMARSSLLAAG